MLFHCTATLSGVTYLTLYRCILIGWLIDRMVYWFIDISIDLIDLIDLSGWLIDFLMSWFIDWFHWSIGWLKRVHILEQISEITACTTAFSQQLRCYRRCVEVRPANMAPTSETWHNIGLVITSGSEQRTTTDGLKTWMSQTLGPPDKFRARSSCPPPPHLNPI